MDIWYVAINGQQQGPFSQEHLRQALAVGSYSQDTLVWRQGFDAWRPIAQVPELLAPSAPSTSPPLPFAALAKAHAIDYQIFGNEMQFVEIELDSQES
ncbi:MAG TPA: DUF4339 domain-containing protein, partial [Desulfoprunum sp.]|nr:DUF4339 domain-containing protein [Desulfoprunum sp.]